MRKYRFPLAFAFACLSSAAFGQGCPPSNGETVDQIEALNQLIIDGDYDALTTALDEAGVDAAGIINVFTENFKNGFNGCTTLVQRSDAGTMKQSAVAFDGSGPVVYIYWRTAFVQDKFFVINLSLQTEQSKIFEDFF